MRVLVTGSGGQLGQELMHARWPEGIEVRGLSRAELDIGERDAVLQVVRGAQLVINAAAYNAVDKAEREPELAHRVNAEGPGHLARACAASRAALVHVSTDYVFDGEGERPYREDDPIAPQSVYARSKAEGEARVTAALERHLVIRTSWVFSVFGAGFLHRIIEAAEGRRELRIVADQTSGPTPTEGLARLLVHCASELLSGRELPWGLYHFAGRPGASRFEYVRAIFETRRTLGERVPELVPIRSAEWPSDAGRPRFSVLDSSRAEAAFGVDAPRWEPALARVVRQLAAR